MSEDTGKIICLQHKHSKSLSWAENLKKLFTVLGGKFKFSAQDSDFEYLCWRCKNSPVSSDFKPPSLISECQSFWSCCTTEHRCGINQGDCDSDNECEGTLTCGIGNCAGHLFPDNADCCQEPGKWSNIFSMFLEKILKSIGCFNK